MIQSSVLDREYSLYNIKIIFNSIQLIQLFDYINHLLFIIYYSSFIIHHLLFIIYYSSFITHYLLFIIYYYLHFILFILYLYCYCKYDKD